MRKENCYVFISYSEEGQNLLEYDSNFEVSFLLYV